MNAASRMKHAQVLRTTAFVLLLTRITMLAKQGLFAMQNRAGFPIAA
jgi:hypothetical protein